MSAPRDSVPHANRRFFDASRRSIAIGCKFSDRYGDGTKTGQLTMSSLRSGKQQIAISLMRTVRVAAWAGEQDRCMAIIARSTMCSMTPRRGLRPM